MRQGMILYEIILLRAGEEIKKLIERSPVMDINIVRRQDELVTVIIRNALTITRNILKQIPFQSSLGPEEWDHLERIGWVHGSMIDRNYSHLRFALIRLPEGLRLLKCDYAAWSKSLIDMLMDSPQIFVV